MTPLRLAVVSGRPDVTQALVDMGADVNFVDADGNPVLAHAINANRTDHLQILVDAGADVNAHDADGRSMMSLDSQPDSGDLAMRILENSGARY